MNSLLKRLGGGAIYLLVALSIVIFNIKEVTYLCTAIIMLGGTYEYFKAIKLNKTYLEYLGYILGVFALITLYIYDNTEVLKYTAGMIAIVVNVVGIINILKSMKYTIEELALSVFGYIYVILFPIYILKIAGMQYGNLYIGLLFTITIATDTFAWLVGMKFGKHKISKISPKKSYEGAIGGIIGAVISLFGYIFIVSKITGIGLNINYPLVILVTIIISIHAQLGDFFASVIKRNFNIKDFSRILGEHGGILDRSDSLIFVTLLTYYLLNVNILKVFV